MNEQEKINWIADYIFKDLNLTELEIVEKYPKRILPEGAKVTRFAPSPTGFIHIGGIYSAMLDKKLAMQSDGIFYLRIEDTDKKREVPGALDMIIKAMSRFGLNSDEGFDLNGEQIGHYGPYIQSQRKKIYQVFVKKLLLQNRAYVCFATPDELKEMVKQQTEKNELLGYRKSWAIWRNKPLDEAIENLKIGKTFVIRFKSKGNFNNKIIFFDQVKKEVELPDNELDIVIMKSDSLPTYHFAHIIDDYLMGTTDVIRGDEWLASVPIHLQLFDALQFNVPMFYHIAPIEKIEENSRRKLSKRKDPEASVDFYYQEGYPVDAIMEYLLNLASSNYEDWKAQNPNKKMVDFMIDFDNLKVSGSLFDFDKLNFFSRELIAKMSSDGVYNHVLGWSKNYNLELFDLLFKNKEYSEKIFNIERGEGTKKRKDIAKWSDVYGEIWYFFDELFSKQQIDLELIQPVLKETARNIINDFLIIFNIKDTLEEWFAKVKEIAKKYNFAESMKEYKLNPNNYKGYVADVAKILRIALTGKTQTPDLYQIINVLGEEKVKGRLSNMLKILK